MPIQPTLLIDRFEMSYRLGENNITPVRMAEDVMRYYAANKIASFIEPMRYANNRWPSLRCTAPLAGFLPSKLTVECGVAVDRNGARRPYLKFTFNVDRLSQDETARISFHRVMHDFLPGGGYGELLEEGNVLYAEFAYDIPGLDIATIDTYSPRMRAGSWHPNADGSPQSIYLKDGLSKTQLTFCTYNKNAADRVRRHYIRRQRLGRIEARCRFNNNDKHRHMTLGGLAHIENPFQALAIYSRSAMEQVFTAKRHANFLEHASRHGLQSALTGTKGADYARRIRLLEACKLDGWNPEAAWTRIDEALAAAALTTSGELYPELDAKARNPRAQ